VTCLGSLHTAHGVVADISAEQSLWEKAFLASASWAEVYETVAQTLFSDVIAV